MMYLNEIFISPICNIILEYGDEIKLKQIERMDRLVYGYERFLNNDMHDYEKLPMKCAHDMYFFICDLLEERSDLVKEEQRERKDSIIRSFKPRMKLSTYRPKVEKTKKVKKGKSKVVEYMAKKKSYF